MSYREDNLYQGGDLQQSRYEKAWYGEKNNTDEEEHTAQLSKSGGCATCGCKQGGCNCQIDGGCDNANCTCDVNKQQVEGGCGCSLFGNSEYANDIGMVNEVSGGAVPEGDIVSSAAMGSAAICAYAVNNMYTLLYGTIIVLSLIVLYLWYISYTKSCNAEGFYVSEKPTMADLIHNEKELVDSLYISEMLSKQQQKYYVPNVNKDKNPSYIPIY